MNEENNPLISLENLSQFYELNKEESDGKYENLENKSTSITSASTDAQYPSAKAIYDLLLNNKYVVFRESTGGSGTRPFIFDGKKRGLYIFDTNAYSDLSTAAPKFTYKAKSSVQSALSLDRGCPILLFIWNDVVWDDLQVDSYFGEYFSIGKNGQLYYNQIKKSTDTAVLTYSVSRQTLVLNGTDSTISGTKTFNSIPKQSNTTAPTQDTEFTNKKYVDDSIAAIPSGVNYFDARQEFLFEGKDVGIYYPTNTNRINFMYKFLSDDTGSGSNGTIVSFIITNKVTAENPDTSKVYAVGTFLDGAGSLKQFVVTYNGTKYIMTYYDNYYAASMLTVYSQTFRGEKTFVEIPKVSSYSAPTSNTQLAAKKYVDDQDNAILSNIASVYSSSATYSIGDYVLYNGVLYVCNTDISTAEEWTAVHWTQTTVMAELTSKIGNINSILATLTTPNTNGGGE